MMTENLTTMRGIMGSPAYMSPEQILSPNSVDGRADIWALGIVLYEMLTGFAPFQARTLPGMLTNIATQPAPSVRRFRLDVPAKLEAVVQKCLEKEPNNRFATAGELAEALFPFLRRESSLRLAMESAAGDRISTPPPSSRSNVPVVFTSSRAERVSEAGIGTRWLGAAAAMLIALVGVLGTFPEKTGTVGMKGAASNGVSAQPAGIERACPSPSASASLRRTCSSQVNAQGDTIAEPPNDEEYCASRARSR